MLPTDAIPVEEIVGAQARISGAAIRTPLLRLEVERDLGEIWLKLENLQPIGSFKLRGASNAMALAGPELLAGGVVTASAGNMAQGVAWNAGRLGVPCRVIVPENAPPAKLDAIERLGGSLTRVPFDVWWRAIVEHGLQGVDGWFLHPVSNRNVIAGNGTIGLELLEDLPDVDAVIVPFGGGGLSAGIASALRARKPDTRIFACEVETAAPLRASLEAGEPREIEHTPSFVDGIGGKSVLREMWPLVSSLLDSSLVVGLEAVAEALRLLAVRNHVIAEGAGAAPVAAALAGLGGSGKIVCVVSGGNLDPDKLIQILRGDIPGPMS